MIDVINMSDGPNPEIENGPKIVTRIPPPNRIKTHMASKNPYKPDFMNLSPLEKL